MIRSSDGLPGSAQPFLSQRQHANAAIVMTKDAGLSAEIEITNGGLRSAGPRGDAGRKVQEALVATPATIARIRAPGSHSDSWYAGCFASSIRNVTQVSASASSQAA